MARLSDKLRREAFFDYKQTCTEGLCWVKGCRRHSKPDRALCDMHHMQRFRQKHEKTATYCTLRDHANRRKIPFTISIDYWHGLTDGFNFFQVAENYVLTIDRVDACKGYEPGNLRVVSLSLNVIKGNRERYLPEHVQEMLRRERAKVRDQNGDHLEDEEEDYPF